MNVNGTDAGPRGPGVSGRLTVARRHLRRCLLRTRLLWALVSIAVVLRSGSILLDEYPRLASVVRRLVPWM